MTAIETLPVNAMPRQVAVGLWGIGTAAPPGLAQVDAVPLAERLSCDTEQHRSFLKRVFLRSGVEQRGTVLMKADGGVEELLSFYTARKSAEDLGPTTRVRMERYAREAPPLAEQAVLAALEHAHVAAREVTHLITVSCTGFVAPGMDVELIRRVGLSPTVRRRHIGFMGCHAAFNALGAARDIVRAEPESRVLVCCVELCSLHFAYGWSPEKLVANALFADGAAAAVVGEAGGLAESGGWRLTGAESCLLPDTLEAMTWRIRDHGFEMTLSAELPAIIKGNLRGWCDEWLGRRRMRVEDAAHWAVHPGGPKILAAAGESLGIGPERMAASYEVLRRHGNMSSATILFVLQELAAMGAEGNCVALGFGPGLMMEGMVLERG